MLFTLTLDLFQFREVWSISNSGWRILLFICVLFSNAWWFFCLLFIEWSSKNVITLSFLNERSQESNNIREPIYSWIVFFQSWHVPSPQLWWLSLYQSFTSRSTNLIRGIREVMCKLIYLFLISEDVNLMKYKSEEVISICVIPIMSWSLFYHS